MVSSDLTVGATRCADRIRLATDKAKSNFAHPLGVKPKHRKIVRAFGQVIMYHLQLQRSVQLIASTTAIGHALQPDKLGTIVLSVAMVTSLLCCFSNILSLPESVYTVGLHADKYVLLQVGWVGAEGLGLCHHWWGGMPGCSTGEAKDQRSRHIPAGEQCLYVCIELCY